MIGEESFLKHLEESVGPENLVCQADRSLYEVDGRPPRFVAAPADADQVAALLRLADQADAKVAPWGGGTSQGLGNPPERIDLALLTTRLNRMTAHEPADMTCVADAGIRFSDLQAALGKAGQHLPIDPPDPDRATLGGVLSAGETGPMRLAYGLPRDVVIETRIALVSGQLVKAGARVVKNVAGFDLNKLYIGALGTLGVIVELALKVLPLPERQASSAALFPSLEQAARAIRAVLRSDLSPCALELVSPRTAVRLSEPLPSGGFLVLVRAEGVSEAVEYQMDLLRDLCQREGAPEVRSLTGTEEPAIWDRVRQFRRAPEEARRTVRCKVSVPLKRVGEVLAAVDGLRDDHQVSADLIAHAGSGVVYCYLDLETPAFLDRVVAAASRLRTHVAGLDGNLVVEAAPPGFKARLDVWGKEGPDLRLMRAIKMRYDPRRTLNPGRYVGGI